MIYILIYMIIGVLSSIIVAKITNGSQHFIESKGIQYENFIIAAGFLWPIYLIIFVSTSFRK